MLGLRMFLGWMGTDVFDLRLVRWRRESRVLDRLDLEVRLNWVWGMLPLGATILGGMMAVYNPGVVGRNPVVLVTKFLFEAGMA